MRENHGKHEVAAVCMSLFLVFLLSGSALFSAQVAQNMQGFSLRSRFGDDVNLTYGILNPQEQFHFQRGNCSSKTGLRMQPFHGAAAEGNSAALSALILSPGVRAAFLRSPVSHPFLRVFAKHCPVRAGPVF